MTRSEENLRVGTETVQTGRARLRKHVVTENQQVTVPVTREEVTLEREPITETNRGEAYDGPAISEEEHEVTLHAERPVVDVEAVAVERVRLGKETVTEQETVGGEVRKEEIELDRGDTVGATSCATTCVPTAADPGAVGAGERSGPHSPAPAVSAWRGRGSGREAASPHLVMDSWPRASTPTTGMSGSMFVAARTSSSGRFSRPSNWLTATTNGSRIFSK